MSGNNDPSNATSWKVLETVLSHLKQLISHWSLWSNSTHLDDSHQVENSKACWCAKYGNWIQSLAGMLNTIIFNVKLETHCMIGRKVKFRSNDQNTNRFLEFNLKIFELKFIWNRGGQTGDHRWKVSQQQQAESSRIGDPTGRNVKPCSGSYVPVSSKASLLLCIIIHWTL